MAVPWLSLRAPTAGGAGSIPGGRTEILPHGVAKKKKKKSVISLYIFMDFPGGSVVRNLPAKAEDADSIPRSGRSSGERNGNPL